MGSVVMAATPMRAMQSGLISFSNTLGTVNVTFPAAMPDANYRVYCSMNSGGSLGFVAITNQTATGFTASLPVSGNTVLYYVALQNL